MAKKNKQTDFPSTDAETYEKAVEQMDGAETSKEVIKEIRTADSEGNGYLPTMEVEAIVIPELRDEIVKNKTKLVPAFQKAQKALQASKELIEELGQKYKEQLLLDEERGVRTYDDGTVHFEIQEKDAVSFSVVKEG